MIVYDKLMALKIPEVERSYTAARSDASMRSASGWARTRSNADEIAVRLREQPEGAADLPGGASRQPGFWARELDTGIDWVKVLHGEHDLVLHKPLPPSGTVIGHDARRSR